MRKRRFDAGDDELPEGIKPADLIKRLDPAEDEAVATLALKTLVRGRARDAHAQAIRVLGNKRFPVAVRSVAAVELGRKADRKNQAALLKALGDENPQVVRHSLSALGRIGGSKSLDRLAELEAPEAPGVHEALEAARTLISYRIGSTKFALAPPPEGEFRPVYSADAAHLVLRTIGQAQLRSLMPRIERQVPGTPMSARTGLAFECGNSDYRVVLAAVVDDDPTLLATRPSIAGAILKYRACSDRFSLDAYLLSSPKDDRSVDLFGLRPSGVTVLGGVGGVVDGRVAFELTTTRSPHYRKFTLSGHFTTARRLRIDAAQVGHELPDERLPRAPRARRAPTQLLL
jgi:hypothetical protein